MELKICDIGAITQTDCHKQCYTKKNEIHDLSYVDQSDQVLLMHRIENSQGDGKDHVKTICDHHSYMFLGPGYANLQRKCDDPDKVHKKSVNNQLREITLEMSDQFHDVSNIRLIPGKKLCTNCVSRVRLKIAEGANKNATKMEEIAALQNVGTSQQSEFSESVHASQSSSSAYSIGSQSRKKLATIYEVLEVPPLEREKLTGARFRVKALDSISTIQNRIVEAVEKSFDCKVTDKEVDLKDLLSKDRYFSQMIKNLQYRFRCANTIREKIETLSLLPTDWTVKNAKEHFQCTRYMFNKMMKFRLNMDHDPRKAQKMYPVDVEKSIIDYYMDQKNCYICPGTRQYLTVLNSDTNEKEQRQKRLLLYTIQELYKRWKRENSHLPKLPGLTFFQSFRPKECLSAGDPGTHSICVCAQHENIKMKIYALKANITYRDILERVVCDVENGNCMLKRCKHCPGVNGAVEYLSDIVQMTGESQITFKTWTTGGNSGSGKSSAMSVQSETQTTDTFIRKLSEDIVKLTTHHYIAEMQEFLDYCKQNLDEFTILVLMDFAENYAFIIQRSVQAWYFNNNNTQATVHPIVVYYKSSDGEIKVANYCVISDSTQHTAPTVYAFQKEFTAQVKADFPHIKWIMYFSDGAPTQYKNKNNFANMCVHERDFGLKIKSYNFFATSHGKSPCDGIGAVAKREITRIALRRPVDQPIANARDMFEAASDNIKGIKFLWVSAKDINAANSKIEQAPR
ncbi:hypothetical protein QAD02_013190 [Eretmocerus hayati]|uniref:Uncharacterized protein n=1 Tax=Eretmocerus hayati TaxID=131215 RepID=A0ACC2P2S0_9HYME|nr:hypothetical protein QAD02_013190 [Eretmocerus hayati]